MQHRLAVAGMNINIVLALIIAWVAIFALKKVVYRLIVRGVGRAAQR